MIGTSLLNMPILSPEHPQELQDTLLSPLANSPLQPEIRKKSGKLQQIRGSRLLAASRPSRRIVMRVKRWKVCLMATVQCCLQMEISTEENGWWAKRKAEDCRSTKTEAFSMKVSGRMTSSMEVGRYCSQLDHTSRDSSKMV